jgi:peptidoglycan-associated lipoprotein
MIMQKFLLATAVCTVALVGTSACATKGFVRTQVGQVSTKVDTLTTALEETQERTKQNETRIGQVDQRAGAAQTSANSAGSAAATADGKAVAADGKATAAQQYAQKVEAATKRIIYEVSLSENQGNFKFGDTALPDDAKQRIDALVAQIKADPKGAYFEIEGHTDNVGDATINAKIGMERAEAVKRYLYEQHQIPLHRMSVISYGEDKPVAPNNTRDGRAQNRRVVLRVLV